MQHPRYFTNNQKEEEDTSEIARGQKDYVPVLLQIIHKNCAPVVENCDGGVYVGAAGIAYAFYHVAETGLFADSRNHFLGIAEKYIKVSLQDLKNVDPCKDGIGASLLLGHAGIYTVATLIYQALGLDAEMNENLSALKYAMANYAVPLDFFKHGSDELFVGRAGLLAAAYSVNKRFGRPMIPESLTLPLCEAIIESGRKYSKHHRHRSPLMYSYYETEYLGAGHGLASILLMLLSFPTCFANKPDVEADIRGAVDFLLGAEQPSGNYPPVSGEERDDWNELVHWCHGAPGLVYLFAKAHRAWPSDDRYLSAALRCGDVVWRRGLLRKGPGICHGIAGNGYVFLLLHQLTGEARHARRAHQFAAFMQTEEFKANSRVPDAPYSLFEGIAGTSCFLADLVEPDSANAGLFPFMDVF